MAKKTAYLHVIDEETLAGFLSLTRIGEWEGSLPTPAFIAAGRVTQADNCAMARAKGSVAGYAMMEGLQEQVDFEDGVLIDGAQYIPTVAFHARMYAGVMEALAKRLAEYDRIVARPFVNRKPKRPITAIGTFGVEIYEDGAWLAPGHLEDGCVIWEVVRPKPDSLLESETQPEARNGEE